MRMTARTTIALLVAVFALAACASDDSADSGDTGATTTTVAAGDTDEVDVCGLLTEDDVAAVVGEGAEAEHGEGSGAADVGTCTWREVNPPEDRDRKVLSLTVGEASEYAEVTAAQPQAQPVQGLGTEAISAVGSTGPIVVATDGVNTYQIQLIGGTEADLPALEDLLGTAMGNLDTEGAVSNPNE